MEELAERPLFALEEQLARQKGILANSNLLRKLPDKGAKVKESVVKLEAELERRRRLLEEEKKAVAVPDVTKLEWELRTTGISGGVLSSSGDKVTGNGMSAELDSDDDEEEEEVKNEEDTLKLLASSQITQRQAKPVVSSDRKTGPSVTTKSLTEEEEKSSLTEIEVKGDPYLKKLVEKDVRKANVEKFVPGKSLKKKAPGIVSPAPSGNSDGSGGGSSSHKIKWDEALLPPQSYFEGAKILSMEETIQISCDNYKKAEIMKATAPPKKTYAYDKLKEQGILGTFTVAKQTSRPVRPDAEDDDLDESDLSHDSITEDSESEESDVETENSKARSTEKTSKDLSSILNKSLKLS